MKKLPKCQAKGKNKLAQGENKEYPLCFKRKKNILLSEVNTFGMRRILFKARLDVEIFSPLPHGFNFSAKGIMGNPPGLSALSPFVSIRPAQRITP